MRTLPTAAAAALVTSLVGISMPSLAGPAMSWSSNDVDYAQDVCMQRANGAFAREGWGNIHLAGSPALAIAAQKGPLAGVILCLDRAIGADHAIAVVFVTGGDGELAPNERERLQHHMAD
ncbi:MAG TPA: hypothetical protein VF949_05060 [Reyranella sp.]